MNYTSYLQKKLTLAVLICAGALSALYSFLLAPLYNILASDIIWAVTWIPTLLSLGIDLLEIGTYVLCFPILIYAFYRLPAKKATLPALCYLVVIVLRYVANLIITWIQNSLVAGDDLTSLILYIMMEGTLLLIACVLATSAIRHFYRETAETDKAMLTLGQVAPSIHDRVFPFTSVINRKNPLQNAAIRIGILLSASRMLTRLLYDLNVGLPSDLADLLWMILYYLSDILIGVIFYSLALLLLPYWDRKEQTQYVKFNNEAK